MADTITVRDEGSKSFTPAPEGQHLGVCVDVIDLGLKVEQFQNNPPKLVQKAAIVFQIEEENPETNKRFEPAIELTVSFGPKSNMRKILGNWRGKSYSDEEAAKGVPLDKLVGKNGLVTIEHVVTSAKRTFAKIINVSAIPKIVGVKLEPKDYKRSPHWERKQHDYAAEVAAFKKPNNSGPAPDVDPESYPFDYEEPLPF